MPRKPAGKKPDDAPPANDTATPLQGHPWWPEIDVGAVAKLNVYRVVYEDRKGFPGAGASDKVLLTPEPLPPAMLTTEQQIAATWGPGYYQVVPLNAANQFVKGGGAKPVTIAGRDGKVPKFVREFEPEEGEDEGGDSEEVRRLKLELKLERDARREERAHADQLLRQQREAYTAQLNDQRAAAVSERESLGALFEQISKAAQMQHVAPQASALAAAGPDWMRDRMERLEAELRDQRAKAHELELAKQKVELAKRAGGDDGPKGDPDLVDQFIKALPLLEKGKELLDGFNSKKVEVAAEAAKVAEARAAFKLGRHAVLPVDELRAARAAGKYIDPSKKLAAIFRELFADGMLPPAYVEELAHHGITFDRPSDGEPAA